jgi:hypothetical protein
MKRLATVVTAFALLFLGSAVRAAEPPNFTYAPQPPGTIIQSQVVYLAGQAMSSQWRGVVSKKLLGTASGMSFYQWYVSIYQIDGTTYKLRYQSPGNGGPFDKVTKTNDATMWFPSQSGSVVGAAQLMGPGIEQLVLSTHQIGADCGSADLTVFGYDAKANKVVPAVTLQNGCDLSAKISRGSNGNDSLTLSGPYYGPHAAMCCPTKNKASATLKYANGKWVETPNAELLYGISKGVSALLAAGAVSANAIPPITSALPRSSRMLACSPPKSAPTVSATIGNTSVANPTV